MTWILALVPVALWVIAAVLRPSPRPFLTVLTIGGIFGAMLVVTHQIFWHSAFQGTPPAIGEGPAAELIPRLAAIPSGLLTGAMIGAIAGLVAAGIGALVARREK